MKKTAILLSLCLLLAGCTEQIPNDGEISQPKQEDVSQNIESVQANPEPLTPDSLDKLLEVTNGRRHAIVKPTPDTTQVENWKPGATEAPVDISSVEFSFSPEISETDIYTMDQAREDVECLFYFYEIGYGPYFYFGGKEAFDAAKEAVLIDLESLPEITALDLQESLVKHLSYVKDAHFAFNHSSSFRYIFGYLSEQAFLQDTAGFIAEETGSRLISVDGQQDFAGNMVLSLTGDGQMVYRYMMLSDEQPDPVKLTFEDGVELSTAMFSSHEAAGNPEESEEIVSLSLVDEIPVITIKGMGFPHANDDMMSNEFLELAEQLKDEPVLIIDLRGNGGGNTLLGQMFYERLTGDYLTPNHYSLTRLVFGPDEPDPDPESFYYVPKDIYQYYAKPQYINDSWKLEYPESRQVVERDQLLIVLVSKNTASSADNFTDLTFNIENSLVIGSNTAGVMISSASIGVKAPNTRTIGQMGFNLAVYHPGHFQEGIGVQPDMWVSGDALEAAVALVKNNMGQ